MVIIMAKRRPTTKIIVQELLLQEPGITQAEICRRIGRSKQQVSNIIQELRKDCTAQITMIADPGYKAAPETRYSKRVAYECQLPKFMDKMLDIVQQLHDANKVAWDNVNELGKKEDLDEFPGNGIKFRKKDLLVKYLAEIRQQNEATMKMIQMMFDGRAVQEFQDEVLGAIAEVDANVADAIRRRLIERRAVRTAINIH